MAQDRAKRTLSWAMIAAFAGGGPVLALELNFGPPAFLPGDAAMVAAVGHQVDARVARGGDQYLAVWCDNRTSPFIGWPFATQGTGSDIYAARLDAVGNLLDASPIMIDQRYGDQVDARVAWNGINWLVAWQSPDFSTSSARLLAVRVAPNGTVLDDPPILLDSAGYEYRDIKVAGDASTAVVLAQSTGGGESDLRAYAIAADGSVAVPGGVQITPPGTQLQYDVACAEDECLIVWSSLSEYSRGRRYTLALQPIDANAFPLPFAQRVVSDGHDFLVAWSSASPPSATIDAIIVTHEGTRPYPAVNLHTFGNQDGACCVILAWDGTHYWVNWYGTFFARVTPDGQAVDATPQEINPPAHTMSIPGLSGAAGGGLQMVWNDGGGAAAYPKDVYAGRVSPTGVLGNETLVSQSAPAQMAIDLAEGDGEHLVVFRSQESGGGRIMAQRIQTDGTAIDAEPIEVASGPMPGLGIPSLSEPGAAWNGSVYMITWSDGFNIFARRMQADRTFVDATPRTIMPGHSPDVAAVGSMFLVIGIDGPVEYQAAHAVRVDGATGVVLDTVPNPIGNPSFFARYPEVITWGDRWLATWQLNLSHDNTIAGTAAAIIETDGTEMVTGPGLGWRPAVAVSPDRALFVAVSHTSASAPNDIEGALMNTDGTIVGSDFIISDAPEKQLRPAVTWNGLHFIVAWEDRRNAELYFDARTDIYGARVTTAGTVLDPDGVPLAAVTVPEVDPAFLSVGATTLLATSTFRPDPQFGAYRIGIQRQSPTTPCQVDSDCNDANPCTVDVCNINQLCTYTGNNIGCDDGDTCTAVDLCIGGVCEGTQFDPQCFSDFCTDPAILCPGTVAGTTTGANSDGTSSCAFSSDSPDVWFSYTPVTAGSATFSTCGSPTDTVLSIHASCPGSGHNQYGCNDDACGSGDFGSSVTINVVAGTTYLLRVSGYDMWTSGDFELTLVGPPCEGGNPVTGDFDGDGDVDMDDYASFMPCFMGPDGQMRFGCDATDLDGDLDCDVADFGMLQVNFGR